MKQQRRTANVATRGDGWLGSLSEEGGWGLRGVKRVRVVRKKDEGV